MSRKARFRAAGAYVDTQMSESSVHETRRNRMIGALFLTGLVLLVAPFLFDAPPVQQGYVEFDELPKRDEQPLPVGESYVSEPVVLDEEVLELAEPLLKQTDEEGYRVKTGERFGEPTFLPANDPKASEWKSWGIQVGSFGSEENARELRTLLRGDGHHVALSEHKVDGAPLIRVAIGPVLYEEDARRMQEEFSKRYGLDSILVKFET